MNDIIQLVETSIKQVLSLTPAVLLGVVLFGIGWLLKKWPLFNSKFIPHFLAAAGGVTWPFLSGEAKPALEVFQGLAIGLTVVGIHAGFKSHFEAKEDGDTKLLRKDPNETTPPHPPIVPGGE